MRGVVEMKKDEEGWKRNRKVGRFYCEEDKPGTGDLDCRVKGLTRGE